MNYLKRITLLLFTACVSLGANAQSEKQSASADGMFIRNNQVYYIKAGQVLRLPGGEQDLAGKAKITHQGLIKFADGTTHQLQPGQLIEFNGTLSSSKIEEYITVKNGSAVVITNGLMSPIEEGFKFGDDRMIDATGTLSDGQQLKNGEMMNMNGQLIK